MPASAPADRMVTPFPEPYSDGNDAHVAAMDRQTAAMMSLVGEIAQARADFKPAADALHSLGDAQAKFCDFIVKNRLKLVGGTLGALMAVGAISPTAAAALGNILRGFGVSP